MPPPSPPSLPGNKTGNPNLPVGIDPCIPNDDKPDPDMSNVFG